MSEQTIPAWPKLLASVREVSGLPHLDWAAVPGAEQYEIYRAGSENGTYALMWTSENTSYTNTSVIPGKTYYYKVRPVTDGAAFSEVARITAGCAQPALKITTNPEDGFPLLKWEAVPGAGKYEVYRSGTRKGRYSLLGTTEETSYRNASAIPGYTYYYRIRAVSKRDRNVFSSYSKTLYITCDCARPAAHAENDPATGKPCITWAKLFDADRYTVSRADFSNGKYVDLDTVTETRLIDMRAKPGKRSYYRVTAKVDRSSYGTGMPSPAVSAVCMLARPEVVTETDDAGQCVLTWQPVDGAVCYEITRAARPNGTFIRIWSTEETRYVVPPMGSDTVYYRVRALSGTPDLVSVPSEPIQIVGE